MRVFLLIAAALLAFAAPAAAKTEVASDGDVRAELSYVPDPDGGPPTDLVERVFLDGDLIVQRRIPDEKSLYPGGGTEDVSVAVRDLDGDGRAEAIFDLFTGGAHCCLFSDVFTGSERQTFQWGNVGYELKDFEGDGVPEFYTLDDRFSGRYSAYAFSLQPVLAYAYTADGLRDFTRDPSVVKTIKKQSKVFKRFFDRFRRKADKQGAEQLIQSALAGYTADRCSLGACEQGYGLISKAVTRGEVRAGFLRTIRRDMRKLGYDRG